MKFCIVFLTVLFLCPTLRAATVTIQGAQTNQVIDGFGVNANHRSWNSSELPPVLDALIDQAGMTLFRVIYDNTDWEGTNDNADSTVFNWTNYNAIYSSAEFTKLWDMMAYLNQRGITNGVIMNFMGYGPAWLCGSANFSNQVLTAGLEDEWAEMIASAIIYARNTRGLQFRSVMPNNEPDIVREGIHVSGASQYITAMRKLAQKLDTNGLGDVKLIGPDLSGLATGYVPSMLADSLVMSKVEHVSVHNYVDSNSDTVNTRTLVQNSAYPDRTVWVTEYNVWCSTCDSGTRGTYDWTYCEGTAKYLLNNLLGGASAGLVYEGYDSYYAHHGAWGFWGLFAVDNENALVKTYTTRKNYYTYSQITKFIRPGAQRLNITGTASPFSPLVAFKHTGLGQITIVGINTSGSAATLNGTLASLPTVPYLNLYYTTATTNLANGGSVPVTNGTNFSATIPADCVFTLTGFTGVNVVLTNPVNGAQFNAPATIPLAATATSTAGNIALVGFYNGTTKLGEATNAPYELAWDNVPMGNYSLTARATDAIGNVGTSAVVNVAVVGPLAQIGVTPVNATVALGATQQFSATGTDLLGHALNPQPAISWSVSGGGTISGTGLFTAGGSVGGPFNVVASNGVITGMAAVSVSSSSGGGTIGNTNNGTFLDNLWYNGAWINAGRFQAASDMTVTTMFAEVGAISGKYKCAIYTDNNGKTSRLLGSTVEVTNPATGWQTFSLTSSLALTNGNYYWLAIWSDDANAKIYYSDSGGTLSWLKTNYGIWPDPITTTNGGNFNYCIYASGTTGGVTLTSISVTPASPSILAGASQQFTAMGIFSDGSTKNLTSQAAWTSSSTAVADINSSGLATATSSGTTTISAAVGAVTSSLAVLVVNLESTRPIVSIASPMNNALFASNNITMLGQAADNTRVAQVLYKLNGGDYEPVVTLTHPTLTTANWSVPLTLATGTNTVSVKSVDFSGNESLTAIRSLFLAVPPLMTVLNNGNGFATPNLAGANLYVGRNCTLTAVAGKNWLFTDWLSVVDGVTNEASSTTKCTFLMQTNLTLIANFVTNRFMKAAGTYYGLFWDPAGLAQPSGGLFTLKTDSRQTFSGKLFVDGNALGFSGVLDLAGRGKTTKPIVRKGKNPLTVWVGLDLENGLTNSIVVSNANSWVAFGDGDRAVFNPTTHPASDYRGAYTLVIPGTAGSATHPAGDGYAILTVANNGLIKASGALADGAGLKAITLSPVAVPVSQEGYWPFYAAMYLGPFVYTDGSTVRTTKENKGTIMGWLTFTNLPPGRDLRGTLYWLKPAWTKLFYPDGFTKVIEVLGSAYVPPALGARAIDITNGVVVCSDGNLAVAFTNALFWNTNNVITIQPPNVNAQKLSLTAKTGLVKGQFNHPQNGNLMTPVAGVLLQDVNEGRGFFLGTNASGALRLQPE